MEKASSSTNERILSRRKQVVEEAIRSRKFTDQQMTEVAVDFILTGLKIHKTRNEIIKSAKQKGNR